MLVAYKARDPIACWYVLHSHALISDYVTLAGLHTGVGNLPLSRIPKRLQRLFGEPALFFNVCATHSVHVATLSCSAQAQHACCSSPENLHKQGSMAATWLVTTCCTTPALLSRLTVQPAD